VYRKARIDRERVWCKEGCRGEAVIKEVSIKREDGKRTEEVGC